MFLDKYRKVKEKSRKNEDNQDVFSAEAEYIRELSTPKGIRAKKKKPISKKTKASEKKSESQPENEANNSLDELNHKNELIRRLAENNATRRDWLEFFNELTPLINTRLEKTLIRIGIRQDKITDTIADKIDEILTEKLCDGKTMKIIAGYENPTGGLLRTAEYVVISWARRRGLLKNAHDLYIQNILISLHTPLGEEEDDDTLMDIIPDPFTNPLRSPEEEAELEKAIRVLQEIQSLADDEKRLALKLKFMFYMPLSDEDVAQIAESRDASPAEIEQELDKIMIRLAGDNKENEKKLDLMANRFTDLISQEALLAEKEKDFNTPKQQLDRLKKDIARKRSRQVNLSRRNQKIYVYPTNAEVAKLLNIRRDKKNDISVWLDRFRKMFEKNKVM